MNGEAFGRLLDDDRFHARPDRAAAIRLSDTVRFENRTLPLRLSSPMASHRGDDKGTCFQSEEMLHNAADDLDDRRNSAAPDADGHRLPGSHALRQAQLPQLRFDLRRHVFYPRPLENLADAKGLGIVRHVLINGGARAIRV
jgi:hypothetical protein